MKTEDKILLALLVLLGLLTGVVWFLALSVAPADFQQGQVYRILFVHVPVAACALGVSAGGLLVSSILSLVKTKEKFLQMGQAWAEVGLILTCLTLFTGSVWGRPTWGTWWTWDARITTTFLLALLFIGYLLLRNALPVGTQRIRVCAVLGIVIAVDVPIIYKSVEWWRTLHQPASLIESRGRTMDPEMLKILLIGIAVMVAFNITLWWGRYRNIQLKAKLDEVAMGALQRP